MNKNLNDAISNATKTLKAGINPQEDFEKNIKYINAACGKESLFPPLPKNPTFEELEKITNNALIACGKKSLFYDPSDNLDQEENIYTKYPEGPTNLERYLAEILEVTSLQLKEEKENNFNLSVQIEQQKVNSKEKSLENKKLKKYNLIMGAITFSGVFFGILSYFK